MPSIVSFRRNVGHAVILIILFSFFSLAYPCLSIHPPTFRDHSNTALASTTPVQTVIAQAIMLAGCFLIWMPFMRMYDNQLLEKEALENKE